MYIVDEQVKIGDSQYSIEDKQDYWEVSSGNKIYYIKNIKGKYSCSCPAFKYSHNNSCKHVEALNQMIGRTQPSRSVPRLPREFLDKIKVLMHRILSGIHFELVGSYRRESVDSKDCDILVNGKKFDEVKTILKRVFPQGDQKKPWDKVAPAGTKSGGTKSQLRWYVELDGKEILVDFLFTEPKYYEPALLFYTGSAEFNKYMRYVAKVKGYKLNQYGLYNRTTDELVALNEKDIFSSLGIKYREPKDRN